MSTTGLIVSFLVIWWLVFFMALPIGVRPPEEPQPGTVPSAPERPYLLWKVLGTTVIAALLTWTLHWALVTGRIGLVSG